MNAVEIEEAISALGEQPFDAAEFPFAFLQAFGNKETTLKRLRKGESNKSDFGGVLHMFEAEDLASGETLACAYADFPNRFSFFLPLAGITTVKQLRESAFDIRATSRLNPNVSSWPCLTRPSPRRCSLDASTLYETAPRGCPGQARA